MIPPPPLRLPETQHLSAAADGTANFNQHLDDGPCSPGLTQVHALHLFSLWQLKLQAVASRDSKLL